MPKKFKRVKQVERLTHPLVNGGEILLSDQGDYIIVKVDQDLDYIDFRFKTCPEDARETLEFRQEGPNKYVHTTQLDGLMSGNNDVVGLSEELLILGNTFEKVGLTPIINLNQGNITVEVDDPFIYGVSPQILDLVSDLLACTETNFNPQEITLATTPLAQFIKLDPSELFASSSPLGEPLQSKLITAFDIVGNNPEDQLRNLHKELIFQVGILHLEELA